MEFAATESCAGQRQTDRHRVNFTEYEKLNIALVAHDGRKDELLSWVKFNAAMLSKHNLFATGTTGRLISELSLEKTAQSISLSKTRSQDSCQALSEETSR